MYTVTYTLTDILLVWGLRIKHSIFIFMPLKLLQETYNLPNTELVSDNVLNDSRKRDSPPVTGRMLYVK